MPLILMCFLFISDSIKLISIGLRGRLLELNKMLNLKTAEVYMPIFIQGHQNLIEQKTMQQLEPIHYPSEILYV